MADDAPSVANVNTTINEWLRTEGTAEGPFYTTVNEADGTRWLLTAEWVEGWLHWRCETAQGAWGLGRRILAGTAERG